MTSITVGTRGFLRFVLAILIVAVFALSYIYYSISRPKAVVYKGKGIQNVLSIYGYGNKPEEQLKQPHDVAFDRNGNIYVTDTGHGRVLVFSATGRFLRKFGRPGLGKGEFVAPLGIAVGADGRVYVADQTAGKVVIFRSDGRVERELRVMMPLKPVVFGKRLYLANYAFINIYDLSGKHLLDRWGGKGKDEGQFDLPTGFIVKDKNRIYIADLNNLRVQAVDGKGQVKWVVGQPFSDEKDRRFGLPSGIAGDEKDRLFVVDAFNHQIEVLDASGASLAKVSQEGQREGELYYPSGIAYAGKDIFAVADKFNDRVQLLKITID